jgi:3-deoxy-D-manno-octulosonic-acid transferase
MALHLPSMISYYLYKIVINVYYGAIRIAAIGNTKAKFWWQGRQIEKYKELFKELKHDQSIWLHAASLGEYEQGLPILKQLQASYPQYNYIVSFYSPSGYEVVNKKNNSHYCCYLPKENKKTLEFFIANIKPVAAIWIKYEYWPIALETIAARRISLFMVAAYIQPNQPFFKWYGSLYRKCLQHFTHFFVQNNESKNLLKTLISESHITVAGDTRFDRVWEIAEGTWNNEVINNFTNDKPTLVAGSTWPVDEQFLQEAIKDLPIKLIIAPHEISATSIKRLLELFPEAILLSQTNEHKDITIKKVLIIDSIGLLSKLYRYAFCCYIGGGFGKGIHNSVEAAVYGKPILFGPTHQRFLEAQTMLTQQIAFEVKDGESIKNYIVQFLNNPSFYAEICKHTVDFVQSNLGSSTLIVSKIKNYL